MFASFVAIALLTALSHGKADDLSSFPAGALGPWKVVSGTWGVQDGRLMQTEAGFDLCAMTARTSGEKAFRITVRFEAAGDFLGGGIVFGASRAESIAESMMVRLDNDVLLYGYFDGKKVFQPTGTRDVALRHGPRTLSVVADPRKHAYSIYVDGSRLVSNAPLEFERGWVGLISCGGPHRFLSLQIADAGPADTADLHASVMPQPFGIAAGAHYLYVLTKAERPIQVWSRDGALLRSLGEGLLGVRRVSVIPAPPGTISETLVLETRAGLVLLDSRSGVVSKRLPKPKGVETGCLTRPGGSWAYAWLGSDGHVTLQPLPPATGSPTIHTTPQVQKAAHAAWRDGKLYVVDSDTERARFVTHIYEWTGADPVFERTVPTWLDPQSLAITREGNLVYSGGLGYYEPGGAVRILRPDGSRVAHAAMFPYGTLSKRSAVAVGSDDRIYVADPGANAVFIYPPDLTEPDPLVTTRPGEAHIRWTAPIARGAKVTYGTSANGFGWKEMRAKRFGEGWDVFLTDLKPNTRYYYRFTPGPEMLPETRPSRVYSFVSAPEKGYRQAVEVRVVVAIYLNTLADEKHRWSIPEEGVVDKVRREFDKSRLFYWRNSRCRFHVNIADYVVIRDQEAIVKGGWLEPTQVRRDLDRVLQPTGKAAAADYDSIVATWAEPGFDSTTDDELGAVGGGGLTPPRYSCFGISGRLNWLMVHEFNHQIDAFYDMSGSIEYWLNHPDYTIHPGRYGQHFDCNAYLNRLWRDDQYLTARFGRIVTYEDRDEDGLPDSDYRFPTDEVRFGSDPTKKDTDGDGLDDLAEFMAGTFSASNPTKADTDEDGLKDGEDPWPLYEASPEVMHRDSTATRQPIVLVDPNSRYLRGSDPSGSGHPAFGEYLGHAKLTWHEGGITLTLMPPRDFRYRHAPVNTSPMRVEFDVDFDNDGWFSGRDNFEFRFDTGSGTSSKGTTLRKDGDHWSLDIPASALGVENIERGRKLGIRLRVEQDGRAVSAFDPWSLFEMELH
ncbi:MAG: hypothetical protein HRF45_09585 [Fimbriimonadia bacterium]|jgi:hypothetical protein